MVNQSSHMVPMMFGNNAALRLGIKAQELGITHALVVTDKGIREAGVIDPLVKNLESRGITVTIFDEVKPDPPEHVIEAGAKLGREKKVDGVIAIGGGSSIDCAKAVNVLLTNDSPISQWRGALPPNPAFPLILIPTTAGTGSEATVGAVITNDETGMKYAIGAPQMYGTLAIVDPTLYVGMPLAPSTYVAFDAFTHSVDSICTKTPEMNATTFAEKAIRLISRSLPKLKDDLTDLAVREDLAYAASLGGYAINGAMCHLTHAVGHTLGAKFHIPHGLCCAFVLPQLVRYYAQWRPEGIVTVLEALNVTVPADISEDDLKTLSHDTILGFMRKTNLPTMKEMNLELDDVLATIPQILEDFANYYSPEPLSADDFKELLTQAYNNN